MSACYTIGLDYGTNSVRAVIVDVKDGAEISSEVWKYRRGSDGILLDPRDPNLTRQDGSAFESQFGGQMHEKGNLK